MTEAKRVGRSDPIERWPFAIGAFFVGIVVCIFMPPLILVIIAAMIVREVVAGFRRTPVSDRFTWTLLGFVAVAVAYLVLAIFGGITW